MACFILAVKASAGASQNTHMLPISFSAFFSSLFFFLHAVTSQTATLRVFVVALKKKNTKNYKNGTPA